MQIRPVDLADDTLMLEIGEVVRRSQRKDRPHAAHFDVASWVAGTRSPDSGEHLDAFAGHDDAGRVLGTALVYTFLLDNRDKAWIEVQVDPAARGAGVGAALVEHAVGVARAAGRDLVMIEAKVPFEQLETHPYRRFAERHGFTLSNVEVVRHQPVPVSDDLLNAWEQRAAAKAAAYRVETHVNTFPEELAPSLCVLLGQLAVDAPTGTVDFEEEVFTPERLAERYATVERMGWDLLETVAVGADGVVAAQSTLGVPRDNPDGHQWGTFVHREHRGHSLGLAVKVANLRALQQRFPHVTRVVTQNGETNSWMIAINEEMGYRKVEASTEYARRF